MEAKKSLSFQLKLSQIKTPPIVFKSETILKGHHVAVLQVVI